MSRWCATVRAASLAVAAVLLGIVAARADDRPVPLPDDVVAAWTAAGMDVGWTKWDNEYGNGLVFHQGDPEPGEFPAFEIHEGAWPTGKLAKLPQPSAPFAIFAGIADANDNKMKALAKFENLQALEISVGVTDEGLKNLAAAPNLQMLVVDGRVHHRRRPGGAGPVPGPEGAETQFGRQ